MFSFRENSSMTENTAVVPEVVESEEQERPKLVLVPTKITEGRDDLNLAEWPLSSLSEKSDPSVKTIYFEDRIFDRSKNEYIPRRVTITGSDAYGLPTPLDEELLLALIQLSKLQGFRSKRVYFTRYQLLQILNWAPNGQSYNRLDQAFNRWVGVTMYYRNAWRDRKTQSWVDESFHMLERVKIVADERHSAESGYASYFEWNEAVFKSFQNGNVKALNYEFFLAIESAIAKRLYRFLDKRFHHAHSLEFELKALCYEHIGLSRKSPVADLKRKLSRAIDELEEKGFLAALTKEERFRKDAPGLWKVLFKKAVKQKIGDAKAIEAHEKSLESLLIEFGVREAKAAELIGRYGEDAVREKLTVATWLREKGDSTLITNPPGYLIASIEQKFEAPKAFKEEVLRAENRKALEEGSRKTKAAEVRRIEREELEAQRKSKLVSDYLLALTEGERETIIERAIESSDTARQRLLSLGGKVAETLKKVIIESYVLEILAEG